MQINCEKKLFIFCYSLHTEEYYRHAWWIIITSNRSSSKVVVNFIAVLLLLYERIRGVRHTTTIILVTKLAYSVVNKTCCHYYCYIHYYYCHTLAPLPTFFDVKTYKFDPKA